MKFIVQNRSLSIAIAVSVLLHAALLLVRFVAPDAFRLAPADPGLEVILVNAKHDRAPLKAEALAQANLDGGGNADNGRAKSPIPDLRKIENGTSARAAKKRIAELEEEQRKLLASLKSRSKFITPMARESDKLKELKPPTDGQDLTETEKAIALKEAEIAKNVELYNKRPKKTQITPSTREVGYAGYYKALQDRIEKIGTINFPQQDGKKLYGELVIYIPVFQDGSIYEKDGGPKVERSSGIPALDRAAIRIVRRAAPFGNFPAKMRSSGKDDVWEVITRFNFTHDDLLQTELRGGMN